jgi:hypothetical protein
MTNHSRRLQTLLAIDSATCAAMGTLLLAAAGPVNTLTRLPAPLLRWAGLVLLPIAAFMAVLTRLQSVPRWSVMLVVAGNVGWVLASIALPVTQLIQPNALGWSFLFAQAAVVAVLARLESSAASSYLRAPSRASIAESSSGLM